MIASLIFGIPFLLKNGIRKEIYLYEKIFLVITGFMIIRGAFSYKNALSIKYGLGIIYCIYIYIVVINMANKMKFNEFIEVYMKSSKISLILNIIAIAIGINGTVQYDKGFFRIAGMLDDPNFMVLCFTPFYILTLNKLFNDKFKLITLIDFLLINITIILTWSKGGILGISVAIILFIIYILKNKKENAKKFLLVLGSTIILFNLVDINLLVEKVSGNSIEYIIEKRLNKENLTSSRGKIWSNALKIADEKPFLGIGAFNFLDYNKLKFNGQHYIHNTWLEIYVENGFIIAILTSIMILILLIKGKVPLFKIIVISSFIQMIFLSAFLAEGVYIMLAIYRVANMKLNEVKNGEVFI